MKSSVLLAVASMMVANCVWGESCDIRQSSHLSFMQSFLSSMLDDSDFYRDHSSDGSQKETLEARRLVTEKYVVSGCDQFFPRGSFEYYLKFSNGREATFTIFERDGSLRGSVYVYPSGKGTQTSQLHSAKCTTKQKDHLRAEQIVLGDKRLVDVDL